MAVVVKEVSVKPSSAWHWAEKQERGSQIQAAVRAYPCPRGIEGHPHGHCQARPLWVGRNADYVPIAMRSATGRGDSSSTESLAVQNSQHREAEV